MGHVQDGGTVCSLCWNCVLIDLLQLRCSSTLRVVLGVLCLVAEHFIELHGGCL